MKFSNTREILKVLDPRFVPIYDLIKSMPLETWFTGATPTGGVGIIDRSPPTEFGNLICLMSESTGINKAIERANFIVEFHKHASPLIHAHAETLARLEIAKQALNDLFQVHAENCFIAQHPPMICLGCERDLGDQNVIITTALEKIG